MAVRPGTYGREMDKMSKGKSLMAQHKRAVHKSSTMTMEDKYDKPSMMDTAILGVLKKLKRKPKSTTTVRTKQVESGLKQAGIDWEKDKPSARLRRKK